MHSNKLLTSAIFLFMIIGASEAMSYAQEADGVRNAAWCFTATTMIKDQSMKKNGGACGLAIVQDKNVALKRQNQLAEEAVVAVKAGRTDEAIAKLQICQCHNGGAQASIARDRDAVLAYLRQR